MFSVKNEFKKLLQRDNLGFLLLGLSSGITSPLTSSTLYAKFAELGISNSLVGLFSILLSIHGIKFLFSPFIGRFQFSFLDKFIGKDRSEILLHQFLIAIFMILIGWLNPLNHIVLLFLLTGISIIFIALYDLKLDTIRILHMPEEKQASAAGCAIMGYRLGQIVSGGFFLIVVDWCHNSQMLQNYGWETIYIISSVIVVASFLPTWMIPLSKNNNLSERKSISFQDDLCTPVKEFIGNNQHWLAISICLILFQFGDALAGTMMNPFLLEIGFSLTQIGFVVKTFGVLASILGGILGSMLVSNCLPIHSLYIGGYLQMFTNFLFLMQLYLGNNLYMLYAMIGFENLAAGVGYTALISYIASICDKRFLTAQYSLLLSLPYLGKHFLSSISGVIVDFWGGWLVLFILSIVCCLPSQIIIKFILKKKDREFVGKVSDATV